MSPDRPHPSGTRRAWRLLSALGVLGAAANFYVTLGLWRGQSTRTEKAVCATIAYAERQAFNVPQAKAGAELLNLARQMRKTGIDCPPGATHLTLPPR